MATTELLLIICRLNLLRAFVHLIHGLLLEHDFLRLIAFEWRLKEGGFSVVRTTDLIVPNPGAWPLRHIYNISSSLMLTLIDSTELSIVGHCSTPDKVEVFMQLCWPQICF